MVRRQLFFAVKALGAMAALGFSRPAAYVPQMQAQTGPQVSKTIVITGECHAIDAAPCRSWT